MRQRIVLTAKRRLRMTCTSDLLVVGNRGGVGGVGGCLNKTAWSYKKGELNVSLLLQLLFSGCI